MFQLLQPLGLFSIAAIAIPLIIHLWKIREGKTLQVGSILLLQKNARQQARSLRLKNIILLLLRCLLLIALAFLLAKPTWQKQLTISNEKGWILIEKESVYQAYKNYTSTIDSLSKAGYRFHYFNKGFQAAKPDYTLKKAPYDSAENLLPYWALLSRLNEQVPSVLPVYLFTDNQLKRFTGARAVVSMNLKWTTYMRGDTIVKSIVKAYKTSADSIRLVVANSTPEATFYTFDNISANSNSSYKLIRNNGRIFLSSKDNLTTGSSEVDTSTLRIAIYTDQFVTDANYLQAAIEAIQEYTGLKIKVSVHTTAGNIKNGDDWVFWLTEKAVPFVKPPPRIFTYEKGKEQQLNSWITTHNNLPGNAETIHLSRLIETNNIIAGNAEPLWKDGFGHTVLNLERSGNYRYHFYSRFNPDWNDLPWSAAFAEMIFDLLINPDNPTKNFDNRIIDTAQLQPEKVNDSKMYNKEKFIEKINLDRLFWIIAFIIFCIERYISLKNKPEMYA